MKVNYLKILKRYTHVFFIGILITFVSCKKNDQRNRVNIEINKWVTDSMRYYYYWNDEIPSDSRLNFAADPKVFFENMLSRNDRFSLIAKADELTDDLQGVSTSTGINISLFQEPNTSQIFGIIKYVVPGSPAEDAGVERGDMFTKVNGSELTPSNYEAVLDPYFSGEPFTITLAVFEENGLKTTDETIPLSVAEIQEPSVHYSSIIETNGGKKVGYIFYNRFLNRRFDELLDAFNTFKAAGIDDLIVDLRYNLGGGIAVSSALSALIMPGYDAMKVFVNYNYNDDLNREMDENNENRNVSFYPLYIALSKENQDPLSPNASIEKKVAVANAFDTEIGAANLNLSRVFVLATDNSASASELVIHNLAPYMDVIHIGDTTIGKNEGSATIKDQRTPQQIDWAIQPIIVKLADKNGEGDYDRGLIPDEQVIERFYLPFSPLGSKEDPLVLTALQMIDPTEIRTIQTKQMSVSHRRTQQAAFELVDDFEEKQINPRPVLLDKDQVNLSEIKLLKR